MSATIELLNPVFTNRLNRVDTLHDAENPHTSIHPTEPARRAAIETGLSGGHRLIKQQRQTARRVHSPRQIRAKRLAGARRIVFHI